MAQYKAAMSRIFGDGAVTTSGSSSASSSSASSSSLPRAVSFKDVIPPVKPGHIAADGHVLADAEQHVQEDVSDGNNNVDAEQAQQQAQQQSHQPPPAIKYIREAWATSLLDLLLPLLWVLIFAAVMTREAFVANLYLPFLGVFAAVLANSVPIGGGIVYIPALAVLGNHVHLTVSFTVATMSVGNGILGALRWLVKVTSVGGTRHLIPSLSPLTSFHSSTGRVAAGVRVLRMDRCPLLRGLPPRALLPAASGRVLGQTGLQLLLRLARGVRPAHRPEKSPRGQPR